MASKSPSQESPTNRSASDLNAVTIGGARPIGGPITLVEYDAEWPVRFEHEASRIRLVVGDAMKRLEHVGSTSVPGLVAKPILDIVIEIDDSRDEATYVAPLEGLGYELRIREPDWWEHRVLKGTEPDVNLHVFSMGCPEVKRMLCFRDWLRNHPDDRLYYENEKRRLAARNWEYVQHYADAKTEMIEVILARASE